MKAGVKIACLMAAALLSQSGIALGQEGKGEPFELVRSLQSLQDQVVRGNVQAHAAQRALLAQIAERFNNLSPDGWRDARNARAAVVFVLSGGTAIVLDRLEQSDGSKILGEALLRGVRAYGEGRLDQAAELLETVDARRLDPGLAGHVAYVKGEMASRKEPAKALAHFDEARLLSPGTIVDEAALRRTIALLAPGRETQRYIQLGVQYLRRYPASVYASGFRDKFADSVAHIDAAEPGRLEWVRSMLDGLSEPERGDLYLTLAKAAALGGKLAMARLAAGRAAGLAEARGTEQERAHLYLAAALVASEDLERGVEMLGNLDRSKLADEELALLERALTVAAEVLRLPDTPDAEPEGMAGARSASFDSALQAIARVDAMLSTPGQQ